MAGCALAAWLVLLTPFGLRMAAYLVEQGIAAGSGMQARIEDVSGVFPFSLRIGRFALADRLGTWLVLSDAQVSWSPSALLRGRVFVHEIAADVVRIRRVPELPPPPETSVRVEWPPRFPTLPPLFIDRLTVDRLILDKELAGQAAVINVFGRVAESGRGSVGVSLAATRLDGDKPLSLRLAGSLNYAAWKLAVKASLADAPGGLVSSALAGAEGGPLDVELIGDGPLDAWKGRLTAALAKKSFLAADLGLAVPLTKNAIAAFSLDATATPPAGLLPDVAAGLLGEHPACHLAGRVGIISGDFFLDQATVDAAGGQLTANAGLTWEKDALTAAVRLVVPDAARLDASLAGELAVTLTAAGPILRPRLTAQLTTKGIKAGPLSLTAANITAKAEPTGDLTGTFPGATITASGSLAGLTGPEGTTLLGDALTLDLAAALDAAGNLTAPRASLTGQGGSVKIADVLWRDGKLGGKSSLDIANVAGAASLIGLRVSGALTATADTTVDGSGKGAAGIAVQLTHFTGTDQADFLGTGLAALLGPAPHLVGKATFTPSGIGLSELTLDGKALTVSGTGKFDATAGTLTAKATAAIPDAAVLGPALGQKCGGALEATAELSGPAVSPHLAVKAAVQKLVYADLALTEVNFDGTAADLGSHPNGALRLTARREGESARLETAFTGSGNQLAFKDLRLSAPEAAFSGEGAVDIQTGRVTGKLAGKAANLAGLGRFTGLPLAGGLTLTATAGQGRTGQTLGLELTASNLRLPGLNATGLTVSAALEDLTTLPRGRASLTGTGLATAGCTLATLRLTATGDGHTLAFAAETKGKIPGEKALELTTKASLALAEKGQQRLTIQTLSGSLDTRKFALTAPAGLAFGEGTGRIDNLALSFDTARLTASGSLGPKETSGKATIDHFPLPLLAAFGLAGIDGTGTLGLTLAGPLARPTVTADLRLDNLRVASEKSAGLPAVTLWAKATYAAGRLSLTAGSIGKGQKQAVSITAGLPVRFALSPFTLDIPPGGALTGQVTADSDLSDLTTLLARLNTRLTGRLTADLTLGGTLAAPAVSGRLALAASRLENADTGLILHNVAVQAEAGGGVLTITKATGEDGKGGSFALTGKIGLTDFQNGPVDLALRLMHLRVAGLDMVTATADGSLTVMGTLSHMQAAGQLTLGPVHINLPNSLPPDVVVIPVTLINDPNAPKTARKTETPEAARHIDLNLKVTLGQSVHVQGMGLESRWAGQLMITGTAAAPNIVGKYYVEKGTIDLFGSNLDITKGELVFHGARRRAADRAPPAAPPRRLK